jgi:hypothetical protein
MPDDDLLQLSHNRREYDTSVRNLSINIGSFVANDQIVSSMRV